MRNTVWPAVALAAMLALLLSNAPVHALENRTWVSGKVDDDAEPPPPCTREQPRRLFGQALAKTNAGGEVSVLDSGHYGRVTITKSISIVAEGVEGGITLVNPA